MPETSLGFPSPVGTEPPNGPGAFEALAEALDAYLLRQRLSVADAGSLPAAGDYDGHSIWVDDQNRHAVWNGTLWVLRPITITGQVSISTTVSGTPASNTITFPAGLFYTAPVVQVTANSSANTVTMVGATAVSTTGATLWVTRNSVTSTTVFWTASLGA